MATSAHTRTETKRADVALALGACAVGLVALVLEPEDAVRGVRRGADALAVALVVGMTVPLIWRRRAPLASLVGPALCSAVVVERGYAGSIAVLFVLFGVGWAAYATSRRTAIALAVGTTVIATALATVDASGGFSFLTVTSGLLAGLVPPLIGDAFRTRAELMATVRAHATELDRLRDAEIRSAVNDERVGIARDIHDIVGHHLSAISLQANAARGVARREGSSVGGALDDIASLSSQALSETRQMLELLRDESSADMAPRPRLSDVDRLAEAVRGAGVSVEVTRIGEERTLPAGVETCAYRIVQEALTNVVRHARPAGAEVVLDYSDGEQLRLRVTDDGRGRAPAARAAGHGLIGMRERAGLVGGRVEAGPRREGGWAVEARLPGRVG